MASLSILPSANLATNHLSRDHTAIRQGGGHLISSNQSLARSTRSLCSWLIFTASSSWPPLRYCLHFSSALTATPKTPTLDDAMDKAFQDPKRALASAHITTFQPQSQWMRLSPPERRYGAFDRDLLALYLGEKYFRYFLEGESS